MHIKSRFFEEIALKVFCELGTSVSLWVRDICDVFSTNEKSMINNDFTICKAMVQFIFILKTQDNNYNIENNVFSSEILIWKHAFQIVS